MADPMINLQTAGMIRNGKMLIKGIRGQFLIDADQAKIDAVVVKYSIPQSVLQKFPDLVGLMLQTESMDEAEREYWYQIMPVMTDEQINKLRNILVNEKEQLTRLDEEYNKDLRNLNDKHIIEWEDFTRKQKRKEVAEAEAKSEVTEKEKEAQLLKELEQTQGEK
ncbi:hypothetical protein HZA39_00375 [Candidatus Peregrinibacteria bacterium]|nr:hypothetical protein [Candidatus Peregrinibacteria bacterium]